MNKKGQEGLIFLLIIVWIVSMIGIAIANSNPYDSYIRDCERFNRDKYPCTGFSKIFQNNTECNSYIWKNQTYELGIYCQDKYSKTGKGVK